MKRQFFFFISSVLFSLNMHGQISLSKSNTDFSPGITVAVGADTAGFVVPATGVNMIWFYPGLTKNSIISRTSIVPSNANFPGATYGDTNLTAVFIPNWYYHYDEYCKTAADGLTDLGYEINLQRYGVTITGNVNDSCIFPQQSIPYGTHPFIMPFPTTMSTSWLNRTRSVVKFELTINSYGLHHAQL